VHFIAVCLTIRRDQLLLTIYDGATALRSALRASCRSSLHVLHDAFLSVSWKWLLASWHCWHPSRMSDDQPLTLYAFRLRNSVTGKWHRARWKATAEEIAAQGDEWVIEGEPVTYSKLGAHFQPWQPRTALPANAVLHPQRSPATPLDPLERFLALTFLRRHVTYCTRRRRFSAAQGAAMLHRELSAG
jgi:hypothetical protein